MGYILIVKPKKAEEKLIHTTKWQFHGSSYGYESIEELKQDYPCRFFFDENSDVNKIFDKKILVAIPVEDYEKILEMAGN